MLEKGRALSKTHSVTTIESYFTAGPCKNFNKNEKSLCTNKGHFWTKSQTRSERNTKDLFEAPKCWRKVGLVPNTLSSLQLKVISLPDLATNFIKNEKSLFTNKGHFWTKSSTLRCESNTKRPF